MSHQPFISGNTNAEIVNELNYERTVATALTAHAGGTQAAALALTARYNRVDTVGSAADSVLLIAATQLGQRQHVKNNAGVNALQMFGAGTDTINAVATATGVALAAGKSVEVICTKIAPAGNWDTIPGA